MLHRLSSSAPVWVSAEGRKVQAVIKPQSGSILSPGPVSDYQHSTCLAPLEPQLTLSFQGMRRTWQVSPHTAGPGRRELHLSCFLPAFIHEGSDVILSLSFLICEKSIGCSPTSGYCIQESMREIDKSQSTTTVPVQGVPNPPGCAATIFISTKSQIRCLENAYT